MDSKVRYCSDRARIQSFHGPQVQVHLESCGNPHRCDSHRLSQPPDMQWKRGSRKEPGRQVAKDALAAYLNRDDYFGLARVRPASGNNQPTNLLDKLLRRGYLRN